ncbi:cancer/testis antigen family 47 member A11 [Nycticebus coucang]|uniref:cancer/testis antigen family 47 member A11 n=1 Tax=Nycticebus coucang TaxID=9470 RepID=UPI00234C97EE|nr:cancer/testis antigen family 47 member A11 [Nycticebus coucang]
MSTTGDGDPTQEGQESPVSPGGALSRAVGAHQGVDRDSDPDEGNMAPVAEVAGVAGPAGGLGEEEGDQEAAPVGAPEDESSEEDSDIGPAEEDEEEVLGPPVLGLDMMVDAHQFPMAGFRFMFLDLVHSLLHRIYYNDHVLIRPHRGRLVVRHHPHGPDGGDLAIEIPVVLHVPPRPNVSAAVQEGEGSSGLHRLAEAAAMAAARDAEGSEPAATEEASEEPALEASEEPAYVVAEEPALEASEEPALEASEEPALEASEEPAYEAAEEPARGPAKEATKEAAEGASEESACPAAEEAAEEAEDELPVLVANASEITKSECHHWEELDQDNEGEEEQQAQEEKENEKEQDEGPERDLDPGEGKPTKSS